MRKTKNRKREVGGECMKKNRGKWIRGGENGGNNRGAPVEISLEQSENVEAT